MSERLFFMPEKGETDDKLDAVIAQKHARCKADGIAFSCVAESHALDFMADGDIASTLGRAVDNATEAVKRLPEEKRVIGVKIGRVGEMVSVSVSCPYDGDIELDADRLPVSPNADEPLCKCVRSSVLKSARKYGGICAAVLSKGVFILNILLFRKHVD